MARKAPGFHRQASTGANMEEVPLGASSNTVVVTATAKSEKPIVDVDRANCVSFMYFSWMTRLMISAYRHGIKVDSLPKCSPAEDCESNTIRLEELWMEELQKNGPKDASLHRAVRKFIRGRMALAMFFFIISLAFGFISPCVFMRELLMFLERPDAPLSEGVLWALGMILCDVCRVMCLTVTWAIGYRTGIRLQAGCLGLLYKKVLRLGHWGESAAGELITLFSNDGARIYNMVTLAPVIIGGPLVAVAGAVYVFVLLGPWAGWGIVIFVVYYPLQYGISRWTAIIRQKIAVSTDQRMQLLHETFSNIRVVKLCTWEDCFREKIEGVRNEEKSLLELAGWLQSVSLAMAPAVPSIAAIMSFVSHIAAGNDLTTAQAYVGLLTWFILSFSIRTLPYMTREGFEGMLAIRRLKNFLMLPEVKNNIEQSSDSTHAVSCNKATFTWEERVVEFKNSLNASKKKLKKKAKERKQTILDSHQPPPEILKDLTFQIKKGKFIGICGTVGSGKSALLKAILGQLPLVSGHMAVSGSIAYVSQHSWLMNGTLKDNVIFGESFDSRKYYNVVHACELNEDLSQLPAADQTEVGEQGVNLSGGQKQRVALARALYASRDIYLLDEPLSAVDAKVGLHITTKCILGALKEKTVIFVSHNSQLLNHCDEIWLIRDGSIVAQGTHEELLQQHPEYAILLQVKKTDEALGKHRVLSHSESRRFSRTSSITASISSSASSLVNEVLNERPVVDPAVNGTQMKGEKQSGSIQWSTYNAYIRAGGGYILAIMVMFAFLLNMGSSAFSTWWLSIWLNAGSGGTTITIGNETVPSVSITDNPNLSFYQLIYVLTIAAILIASFARSFLYMKMTLRASSTLHNLLLRKLFQASSYYYTVTPIGYILSLFSYDIDEMDARLPITSEMALQNMWQVFFSLLFICIVFPWFILPLFLLLVIFLIVRAVFRVAARDLKRLENASRTPLFSHVSASVQGLSTIKAFGKERLFLGYFMNLYNSFSVKFYLQQCASRWMAVRLDTLALTVTAVTAGLAVGLRASVPVAFIGLALSYSAQMTGVFQYLVRLCAETEAKFTSVERVQTTMQGVETEPVLESKVQVSSDWPSNGMVHFRDVWLRYASKLPYVLHNINLSIDEGEKIGIVGRTGAGKTSLFAAILRLVELSTGSISIDYVDIANVDLKTLRSRIGVIPQDPCLFAGTVRWNLDPEGYYSDAEIWGALHNAGLASHVREMDRGLDTFIEHDGANISAGEGQLMCLARALLKKCRILLMDEATAFVDAETEAVIQNSLKRHFNDCTVLSVAHRLDSVLHFDRVIVMDEGKVMECGPPSELAANPNSALAVLIAASVGVVQKK